MIIEPINIEHQLEKRRAIDTASNKLLQEVQAILNKDTAQRNRIETNIENGTVTAKNDFVFELLETNKIYHINQIRNICITYRLRFLDSKYFKGEIPQAAVSKIKHLEHEHTIEIHGYKILAPSKLFQLEDKDDPLLFAPIGNDYFYLIHKWGNDLHPLRSLWVWPFKNVINLGLMVVLLSILCTALIPEGLFTKSTSGAQELVVFFFMFKSVAAVVVFYWVALGKDFNPAIWNSRYMKS